MEFRRFIVEAMKATNSTAIRVAEKADAWLECSISLVLSILFNGRGGGIRTPGPLLPKQMRYQAALRPDVYFRLYRGRECRLKSAGATVAVSE